MDAASNIGRHNGDLEAAPMVAASNIGRHDGDVEAARMGAASNIGRHDGYVEAARMGAASTIGRHDGDVEAARMAAASNIGRPGHQFALGKWDPPEQKPKVKHLLAEITRRGGKRCNSLSANKMVDWLKAHPPPSRGL